MFDIEFKQEIFSELEKYISGKSYLFLWISGWPDSMFLFYLIKDFFEIKWLDTQKIYILHYNHWTRKESDKEEKYLKKIFLWYNFLSTKASYDLITEENMREERFNFFEEQITKFWNKNSYLFLWHNLTDRIETSFLNLLRGSDVQWFLNMSFFSDKLEKFNIIRPLIWFSKKYIKSLCDYYSIDYFEDKTNEDISISKRNFIREKILNPLEWISNKDKFWNLFFYNSFINLYSEIEKTFWLYKEKKYSIVPIKLSKYRNVNRWYEVNLNYLSSDSVILLLKDFWFYDLTKNTIKEFSNYLIWKNSWYKYIWGVYFFKLHWRIYIIKWEKNFREKEINEDICINKKWYYSLGDFGIDIDDENMIWAKLRFKGKWDKYHWKSVSKHFLNKKIPFFRRNFVPIVEKESKIIKILDFKYIL